MYNFYYISLCIFVCFKEISYKKIKTMRTYNYENLNDNSSFDAIVLVCVRSTCGKVSK